MKETTEEPTFRVTLGSVELKKYHKFENGKMVTYGYSINLDRNGIETSRTEPSVLSSCGYSDGKTFLEEDYNSIMTGKPKKGFWAELFGWGS